jgi:hypothetical protein
MIDPQGLAALIREGNPMRFMMLVIPKVYENAAADFVPPADLVAKMTKFNESLAKAARVAFGGGKSRG